MVPATNVKKRALMPSSQLRRTLRGAGHRLSAVVQIGKGGIRPALIKQVETALADHELIKIKVAADSPSDRFAVAERLAEQPGVNVVQIVGGAILIYKRHPRTPRYEGPRARAAADPAALATSAARPAAGPRKRGGRIASQRRPRR
ncbi:MAG TPA: YhbY family RNA-binding protein [Polyangia bacterium]|jgi:RNA-binding protein|nr:YhbY family RNA-binding protein [Polyangia bacterium]